MTANNVALYSTKLIVDSASYTNGNGLSFLTCCLVACQLQLAAAAMTGPHVRRRLIVICMHPF